MAGERVSAEYLLGLLTSPQPIHELMRDNERKAGFTPLIPGDAPWLPAGDWHDTVVVSTDHRQVRLVAILAKRPGNGAFRRLVAGIVAAGLKPVVVEPTDEMRKTLRRWGWRGRWHGHGFETSEERWTPTKAAKACLVEAA